MFLGKLGLDEDNWGKIDFGSGFGRIVGLWGTKILDMEERSWSQKITDILFNNSQILILAFLLVLVAGIYGLVSSKREGFPAVSINTSIVTVIYPGASAVQIEEQVIRPIEQTLADLDSVEEYQTVANDNAGVAVVTFADNVSVSEGVRELTAKMAQVSLPEGANAPEVQEISAGESGDFLLAVTGPSEPWALYREAKKARAKLESVEGVARVSFVTEQNPQIVIDLDNVKLATAGLSREQVEGVIKSAQVDLPIGSIINSDNIKINVGLSRRVPDVEAIKNLLIGPDLRLWQVAEVYPHLDNNDNYAWIGYRDGEEVDSKLKMGASVTLSIQAKNGADLLHVAKNLDEAIEDFQDDSDQKVKLVTIFSQAEEAQRQINEIKGGVFGEPIKSLGALGVIGYLFSGVGLILLVLFLFINIRVALLALVSLPLSLLAGVAFLKLAGIPLNTIVLFSLVLVIGLVVDPTIVFLEAMQRHKEQGYRGRELAAKVLSSVGLGATLGGAMHFLVFIPFGVVSGFFGQIIRYIPLTVIPSVIASILIPVVFLIPVGIWFLSSKKKIALGEDIEMVGLWGWAKRFGEMITNMLRPGAMKAVLRTVIVVLAVVLPFAVAGYFMQSGDIRFVQFSQPEDSEMMLVDAQIPDSWTIEKSVKEVAVPVENLLAGQPEVKNFAFYQQNGNSFTLLVSLFDPAVRRENDLRVANDLMEDLNSSFANIKGAEVEASLSQAGPPQDKYPVKVQIFDNDLNKLRNVTNTVATFLKDQEGVVKVDDTLGVLKPKVSGTTLVLQDDNLSANPFLIFGIARSRLAENDLTKITLEDEVFEVKTRLLPELTSVDEVKSLPIAFGPGGVLNIGNVISETEDQYSTAIQRINGDRYVEIRAKVDADTDPITIQNKLNEYLSESKLEDLGLDPDATKSKGSGDSIAKSFEELFTALFIAMALIYVLLVAFMRSFVMPIIVLFAVPLGFVAIFPALAGTTGQLGFLELLGVVAMAGIVVNVTILLIDFANQMKRKGLGIPESAGVAVAVRMRPILLTTATVLGGLFPLIIYSPFWQGLAVVLSTGVAVSAILSLFVTPVLYLWAEAVGRWFASRGQKLVPAVGSSASMVVERPVEPTQPEPVNDNQTITASSSQISDEMVEENTTPQPVEGEESITEKQENAGNITKTTGPSEDEIRELLNRIIQNRDKQ